MHIVMQILLTAAAAGYSLIPVLADFNRTHSTNPAWDPHARFHVVWQVSSYVGLALVSLYLVWLAPPSRDNLLLAAVLALCAYGGFFTAAGTMRMYRGSLYSANGIVPIQVGLAGRVLMVDVNLAVFAAVVGLTVIPTLALLACMG